MIDNQFATRILFSIIISVSTRSTTTEVITTTTTRYYSSQETKSTTATAIANVTTNLTIPSTSTTGGY